MIEPSFEERARVSAPVMRTFANIAQRWGLSEKQQSQLLECDLAKLREWTRIAQRHTPLVLETSTLLRISVVLGVFADLRQFFASIAGAHEERGWLFRRRQSPPFNGRPPLAMLCGSFEDQMAVRRHLTAIVGGIASSIEVELDASAHTHDDVVLTGLPIEEIKGVCFDAFGTVVEIADKRRPFQALLQSEPSSSLAVRALTHPIGLRELSQQMAAPVDEERLVELEADLEAELVSVRLRTGMDLIWRALRKADLKIAICSNLAAPYKPALIAQLPEVPEALVLSFEVGLIKPQQEIYRRVFNELDLRPSEVLFVGDSLEADVVGPGAAGAIAMPIAEFEASYSTRASFYAPPAVAQLFERIATAKAG